MRELVLNGADWATKDDVYDAFFHAVAHLNGTGATSTHSLTAFRAAQLIE